MLRRLKPVWLMSPLSVADILPLEEKLFDVVIFDEASQIPLEDAIPTLYRSQQMIVVGDEMQLPPSSFFSAQGGGEDDERRQLRAVRLRPQRRQLPEPRFGAAAAHAARLALPQPARGADRVLQQGVLQGRASDHSQRRRTAPARADPAWRRRTTPRSFAEAALEQPLSFHRMKNSPYDSQRNPGEAAYIAWLVREILNSRQGAEHRRGGVLAGPAERNRDAPSMRWRPPTAISARCSTWRRSARTTASTSACSSRTWRTCRATSAT